MYKQLNFYRIAFLNMLLAALLFLLVDPLYLLLIKIFICLMNAGFLAIVLHNLPSFLKRNNERLFIGRKRTLIVFTSSIYISVILFSLYYELLPRDLFIAFSLATLFIAGIHFFANPISVFLHRIFKKNRRIAIVGFDDNAHKLAEKLKRKSNNYFIRHLNHESVTDQKGAEETLSGYIDFAKKNRIKEFFISVPDEHNSSMTGLAEEAEKHCIRVNFIAPQQDFEPGFYHINYIGGMPVLQRYKEPLRRLRAQIIKRIFDLAISSLIIIFILSWLIPLVSILIKLESKGPVFFKQLRSGRDNNSFMCLKFRSMFSGNPSETTQATKGDKRITKVGAFLRKTSLDEFPQFLNVFIGDMSIIGPRPHMLHHTEQYSGQVNHYMVRLYLKPGVTGWAQVNGYRGEIKNIELMKNRVEHDIWYMENWSSFLDIKIMYLTLKNVVTGEENAY